MAVVYCIFVRPFSQREAQSLKKSKPFGKKKRRRINLWNCRKLLSLLLSLDCTRVLSIFCMMIPFFIIMTIVCKWTLHYWLEHLRSNLNNIYYLGIIFCITKTNCALIIKGSRVIGNGAREMLRQAGSQQLLWFRYLREKRLRKGN